VDCDFVDKNLGPKLKADPENLKLAKNILRLAFAGKCMDLDVALDAAKVVEKNEPEYAMAKIIAQLCASKKDFECARHYYEEAISLTEDNTQKADVYYYLATIMASQKKKASARNYARLAINADPTKKEAYKLIGDLYFNSYGECKKGENPVHDRCVYLASYEMYKRAGDGAAMKRAHEQFPTMEEIFTWNLKVGDKIKIGCWINESVAIQKR
jgi:tetratricopeptide (TPR) repeat protein